MISKTYEKNLKLYTGYHIVESNLSKEEKLNLLNFIQHEATYHQIMSLLMYGKFTNLNEDFIESRFRDMGFKKFFVHEANSSSMYKSIFGKERPIDPKMKDIISKKAATISKGVSKSAKQLSKTAVKNWNSLSDVQRSLSTNIAIYAAIAAASVIAYKMYKRFLTKSGVACKSFKGNENDKCQIRFKIKAAEKVRNDLMQVKGSCKTKEAAAKMSKQVIKWDTKVAKLKNRLNKLN